MFLGTYYCNKLIHLKKEFSSNEDQQALAAGLVKYEKNIKHCVKQLFEIDFGGEQGKTKVEGKIKSKQSKLRES